MSKHLPPYPSLESLHNQAKQILKAYRAQGDGVQRRICAHHPRYSRPPAPSALRLADAQLVVAREYGYQSWPRLKRQVDTLNGLSTAVPVGDADGITPAWLTERLRLRGHLPLGQVVAVERRDTQPQKEGVHRLAVRYSPDAPAGMPTSFVYKFNKKGLNRRHPSGTREAFFYRRIVPQMPDFAVAGCFDIGLNEGAGQSYLLLEDLEGTHHLPPARQNSPYGGWLSFEEVPLADFEAVVDKLARFQARWWDRGIIGREPLSAVSPGLASLNDAGQSEGVAARLEQVGQLVPELGAAAAEVARQAIRGFPALYQGRLAGGKALTLVHVDFHLRSVFLPDDPRRGEVMFIDWESVQRSIGVSDIAHLLLASMLPAPTRREYEERLLPLYQQALAANGVVGYDLEACRADYRLAIIGLSATVLAPPFLRACNAAFEDWRCRDLLAR